MSWWRCPTCQCALRHDDCAEIVTAPIVKPRAGGVDQFSVGSTRLTCPDHPGVWLLRGRYPQAGEARNV